MQELKLEQLKEELPYKWKVQTAGKYSCTIVAYIDARILMDHLDKCVGPQNWANEVKQVGGYLMGGIGVKIDGEWVWKWDVGTPSAFDKEKGHVSDAYKRAGVHWGVGRFLYDKEMINISSVEVDNKNLPAHNESDIKVPITNIPRGIMVKKKGTGGWYSTTEIKNVNRYIREVYLPYKEKK